MPRVNRQDINKIIFDNFNDTDIRFSNDEIMYHLKQLESYKELDDVLEIEDVLLEMEKSGMLRPIAQNFNTRYYRLWNILEQASCKECSWLCYFGKSDEGKACTQCGAKM